MGYLHEGHLELVRAGKRDCAAVAVSIFVNPLQFNDPEDFKKYPVDIDRDLGLCAENGADFSFVPSPEEMYPGEGPLLKMTMPDLTRNLCGEYRPGHFEGVLMVVARLFNLFQPEVALFGRKDYQQFLVIHRLAQDLDFPIEVIGVPTVREEDGLAMSSRNARLSNRGREHAELIHRGMRIGEKAWREGNSDAAELREIVKDVIESGSLNRVEYLETVHPDTLMELERVERDQPFVFAVAVFCDGVRLIDNLECRP